MGVDVIPKDRDNSTDITHLTVKYKKGTFETPNRFVNRNDLNAKSDIGADIPLTRVRKCFVHEVAINPEVIENIQKRNGYLGEFKEEINKYIVRVQNTGTLKAVFPRITSDATTILKSSDEAQSKVVNFLFQLMSEFGDSVDLFMYQVEKFTPQQVNYLNTQNSPYVPIIDIHHDKVIKTLVPQYMQQSPSMVPFIGFTYASFTSANLSFDYLMTNMDKIHESNKGIITVGAPRTMGKDELDQDVSAPHYSSFLISDIVSEKYETGFRKKQPAVNNQPSNAPPRIFEKGDLTVPVIPSGHSEKEHEGEDELFLNDTGLLDLFWRTVKGENTELDIKKKRVHPMSRVHESIITNLEFENMRKSILSQELTTYRKNKFRLNKLLNDQGVLK